jgi:hypothetical protein
MGYVHNTAISEFISPFAFAKTAGTWTPTIASNVVSDVRTAAGAAFTVLIPLVLPGSASELLGAKIISVDVFYKIATNAATAFAVALDKVTIATTGAATGAAVAHTFDAGHDTEAERYAVADHMLTATITAPHFVAKNTAYWLSFVITAHANTVYTAYGAQVNYQLRL